MQEEVLVSVTFKLQDFEGPLDLLLYLIEKNKMNIHNIEISAITDQYMSYLEEVYDIDLESLSDFIVMASHLLLIKSNMLLPKNSKIEETEEEDPREELINKLLEYKKIKYVSSQLSQYQHVSEYYCFRSSKACLNIPEVPIALDEILSQVRLQDLYHAFQEVLKYKELDSKKQPNNSIHYSILKKDVYTIEKKSEYILDLVKLYQKTSFFAICHQGMSKLECIVTFMALLELIHKKKVTIIQDNPLGDIEIVGGSAYEEK